MKDPQRLLERAALDPAALPAAAQRALAAGAQLTPSAAATAALWRSLAVALPPPPVGGGGAAGSGAAGGGVAGGGAANGGALGGGAASGAAGGTQALGTLALAKSTLTAFGIGLAVFGGGGTALHALRAEPQAQAPVATVRAVSTPDPAPAPTSPHARPAPSAVPPRPERARHTPAPTADDALAEEARLLAQARTELQAEHPSAALTLLRETAARFPAGGLVEERTALEVEALARLGRREEAGALGDALLRAHPRTPHAQRVRDALTTTER